MPSRRAAWRTGERRVLLADEVERAVVHDLPEAAVPDADRLARHEDDPRELAVAELVPPVGQAAQDPLDDLSVLPAAAPCRLARNLVELPRDDALVPQSAVADSIAEPAPHLQPGAVAEAA